MAASIFRVILVLALMPQLCAGEALSKEELAKGILSARSLIHTWKVRCDMTVKCFAPSGSLTDSEKSDEIIRNTFE